MAGTAGCSDRTLHLDQLQSAFQSAPPEAKTQLDAAIADINATNFAAALPLLQKVAFGTKMTKEQRDALEDTIRKLRQKTK